MEDDPEGEEKTQGEPMEPLRGKEEEEPCEFEGDDGETENWREELEDTGGEESWPPCEVWMLQR
jgi:hypothetical protein